MLDLVHKIRKDNEDTRHIKFSVNPGVIDKDFIQIFGSKSNNSKSKEELDQLDNFAASRLQKLKKDKNLTGYDFRSLNKLKRGYLSLARLVAISVYQYKLNLSASLSKSSSVASLSSICEEAPTLTESTSLTFKPRKSFLPEEKIEEIHGEVFSSTPKLEIETTFGSSGKNFEKNKKNLEQVSEESTSVASIRARDTPVMSSQINLTDVLKNLPKYDPDIYITFEDYVNKLNALFGFYPGLTDSQKIQFLKFSVAQVARLNAILMSITNQTTFTGFSNQSIELIDGKIKSSSGEILSKAWGMKSRNFPNLLEYYHAFNALRSEAKDPTSIDESQLVQPFLKGLDENLVMHIRGKINSTSTLLDVFKKMEETVPDRCKPQDQSSSRFAVNYSKPKQQNTNNNRWQNNKKNPGKKNYYNNQNKMNKNNNYQNKNNHNSNKNANYKSNNKNWRNDQNTSNRNNCQNACCRRGTNNRNYKVNNVTEECCEEFDSRDSVDGNETDKNGPGFFGESKTNVCTDLATNVSVTNSVLVSTQEETFPPTVLMGNSQVHTDFQSGISGESVTKIYKINAQKLIHHEFLINKNGEKFVWDPIVDSGAERSTISLKFAENLGLNVIKKYHFRVIGFDGSSSNNVVGFVENLHFIDPNSKNSGVFSPIVINNDNANFCGLDIISCFPGGRFMKNIENEMFFEFDQNLDQVQKPAVRIKSSCSFKIPPGETRTVEINKIETNTDLIISSKNTENNKIFALDGVVDKNTEKITIFNASIDKEIQIQKDQILAKGFEADLNVELGELAPDSNENTHKSELSDQEFLKICEPKIVHLDNKTKQKVSQVLLKHKKVFDISHKNIVGQYPTEVSINPNHKEIAVKPEKKANF